MTGDSDAQPRHKLHYEIAKGGDTRHRRRHFSKSSLAAFGGRVVWSWCPLVCAGGVATQVCPASTVGRSLARTGAAVWGGGGIFVDQRLSGVGRRKGM